jgi:Ca-activated chloride channel family protein
MRTPDEHELTRHLVDEVDAETAAAVDARLRDDPEWQAAADETQQTARHLRQALAAEPLPALTDDQRRAIVERSTAPRRSVRRAVLLAGVGSLAATLAIAVGAHVFLGDTETPKVEDRLQVRIDPAPAPPPASSRAPAVPMLPAPALAPGTAPTTVAVFGTVLDESGAPLPGARIEALGPDGNVYTTTAGGDGRFGMTGVPPGRVELKAKLPGFMEVAGAVSARGGNLVAWSPTLRVAAMTESITVTGAAPRVMVSSAQTLAGQRSIQAPAPTVVVSGDQSVQLKALGYVGGARTVPGPVGAELPGFNTEGYGYRADNDFLDVAVHPQSTFAMDVDTASNTNVRRFLTGGQLPPADAVRIEEMINYFTYDYPPSRDGAPFAAHVEVGPAPWRPGHRLVRIGLKAREIEAVDRPASNLVFLIDVSGSMDEPAKHPLVQASLRLLVDRLDARDRVAIVVYAGAAGLVLPSTPGDQKAVITAAIDRLRAGGSTNGGEGIQLAYDTAAQSFIRGGVNRVILATDGDFNVGLTDQGGLVRMIQEKAKQGVFLSALGFGMGNYKDDTLESLADKGNGNYAYIDTIAEARRALVEQMNATLVTVAKDAKIQVEFNPAQVASYRLLGYENRLMRPEEFEDDAKDGGEVGAGHTVTALYEVVPAGGRSKAAAAPPLRYQGSRPPSAAARGGELLTVSVRYKEPDGSKSSLLQWPVADAGASLEEASPDFRFAAGVAAFGMLLRDSPHRGQATAAQVVRLARSGLEHDAGGYRAEFLSLVHKAQPLLAARAPARRP